MAVDRKNAIWALLRQDNEIEEKRRAKEEPTIDIPPLVEDTIVLDTPEVWELNGDITPKYIKILIENGIESFEDILETDFQAMVDIDGIGKLTAGKIYDAVEEILKDRG